MRTFDGNRVYSITELDSDAKITALKEIFWNEYSDYDTVENAIEDKDVFDNIKSIIADMWKRAQIENTWWRSYDKFDLIEISWTPRNFLEDFPATKKIIYETLGEEVVEELLSTILDDADIYLTKYDNHFSIETSIPQGFTYNLPNSVNIFERIILDSSEYNNIEENAINLENNILKFLHTWFNKRAQSWDNQKEFGVEIWFTEDGHNMYLSEDDLDEE